MVTQMCLETNAFSVLRSFFERTIMQDTARVQKAAFEIITNTTAVKRQSKRNAEIDNCDRKKQHFTTPKTRFLMCDELSILSPQKNTSVAPSSKSKYNKKAYDLKDSFLHSAPSLLLKARKMLESQSCSVISLKDNRLVASWALISYNDLVCSCRSACVGEFKDHLRELFSESTCEKESLDRCLGSQLACCDPDGVLRFAIDLAGRFCGWNQNCPFFSFRCSSLLQNRMQLAATLFVSQKLKTEHVSGLGDDLLLQTCICSTAHCSSQILDPRVLESCKHVVKQQEVELLQLPLLSIELESAAERAEHLIWENCEAAFLHVALGALSFTYISILTIDATSLWKNYEPVQTEIMPRVVAGLAMALAQAHDCASRVEWRFCSYSLECAVSFLLHCEQRGLEMTPKGNAVLETLFKVARL